MLKAPVVGGKARAAGVTLDAAAFGAKFHGSLVHESVRAELNARRRGTAATKTRAQVSGGGAKPWRQKGTGRARAGSIRSPLWAGGGVTFGPQPRSYTTKVNRKERRAALRSALSLHAERGSLAILDASGFDEPATRKAAELLSGWDQSAPTLVVLAEDESAAALSFRNLADAAVKPAPEVGVADVVWAASLLVSHAALEALTARAIGRGQEPEAPVAEEAAKPKTPKAKEPVPEKSEAKPSGQGRPDEAQVDQEAGPDAPPSTSDVAPAEEEPA